MVCSTFAASVSLLSACARLNVSGALPRAAPQRRRPVWLAAHSGHISGASGLCMATASVESAPEPPSGRCRAQSNPRNNPFAQHWLPSTASSPSTPPGEAPLPQVPEHPHGPPSCRAEPGLPGHTHVRGERRRVDLLLVHHGRGRGKISHGDKAGVLSGQLDASGTLSASQMCGLKPVAALLERRI